MKNIKIADKLVSPDITMTSGTPPAQIIQAAREVQSEYDKEIAARKANKAATDLYRSRQYAKLNEDIRIAQVTYDSNQPPAASPPTDNSPIPSWHIVAQNYWLGYHANYGVLMVRNVGEQLVPLQLLNKKQIKFVADANNDKFSHLTKTEFDVILSAKPSFDMLQLAYRMNAIQRTLDNIVSRMELNTATIVF